MIETIQLYAKNPTFLKLQRLFEGGKKKNITELLNIIDQLQDLLDELWFA
jgi:hypothetical protein